MIAARSKVLSIAMMLLLVSASLTMLTGCPPERRTDPVRATEPTLTLMPTASTVYEGEVVSVMTRTQNLLGREADIQWATTGGELTTEDNDRIARVRFDRAGTYVVSAQLFVNGELRQTDTVTVNVRPIRERRID
jgi:hypothetical protein